MAIERCSTTPPLHANSSIWPFIAKQEIRMECAWELDNPLYELLAIHIA